jgi:hypothetical protein
VYGQDKVEQYVEFEGGKSRSGGIFATARRPDMFVDWAIGVRLADSEQWISPQDLDQWILRERPDSMLQAEHVDINGVPHRMIFDPSAAYALREYEVRRRDGGPPPIHVLCRDFVEVNGLQLPKSITVVRQYVMEGEPHVFLRSEMTIDDYRIGQNEPADLTMVWPPGISVFDQRDGRAYRVRDDGQLDLVADPGGASSLDRDPSAPATGGTDRSAPWFAAAGATALTASIIVVWNAKKQASARRAAC